jgi:hypothetical protein
MDFGVLAQTLKKDVSFAPRTVEENAGLLNNSEDD